MIETAALLKTAVRVLPPEEHHRLVDFPFAERGLPNPDRTVILVAENEAGAIVGVWAALTVVHLDGLWVAPDYRRSSRVAVQLLRTMKQVLTQLGILQSFTYTESADVMMLALKAGFTRLPGDLLFLDLTKGDPPCPSPPPFPG
jgi:N-acetylglutamate synthase-like GNAT family acetyltransferase